MTIAYEDLKAMFDTIADAPMRVHGTPDYPHLFNPRALAEKRGYCIECGVPYADLEELYRRSNP